MKIALLRSRPAFAGAVVLAVIGVMVPAPSFAADWNIDQLMQSLAQAKPGRASFVEKKYIVHARPSG